MELYGVLEELTAQHDVYFEMLKDAKKAVGMDVMLQANRLYAQVKLESKHIYPLSFYKKKDFLNKEHRL